MIGNGMLCLAAALLILGAAGVPLSAQDASDPNLKLSAPEAPASVAPQAEAVTHALVAPGFSVGARGMYMGDPDNDFDDGELFGGATVRFHIVPFLSLEGFGAYHEEEDEGFESYVAPLQLSALIYPIPYSPVSPYLIGGIGWYFWDMDFPHPFEPFDDNGTEFGYHAGLGIDFQVTRNFSITIDGRYIWFDTDGAFLPELTSDDKFQLMGGINIDF